MDILVVENDDECRIGVSKILMDRGHRVISGRNLEEAPGLYSGVYGLTCWSVISVFPMGKWSRADG